MEENFNTLVDWLSERNKSTTTITETVDLVESNVLNSLLFAEYIMMIEDLSGVEIEVDDDLLEQVRTLSLVKSHYFNT